MPLRMPGSYCDLVEDELAADVQVRVAARLREQRLLRRVQRVQRRVVLPPAPGCSGSPCRRSSGTCWCRSPRGSSAWRCSGTTSVGDERTCPDCGTSRTGTAPRSAASAPRRSTGRTRRRRRARDGLPSLGQGSARGGLRRLAWCRCPCRPLSNTDSGHRGDALRDRRRRPGGSSRRTSGRCCPMTAFTATSAATSDDHRADGRADDGSAACGAAMLCDPLAGGGRALGGQPLLGGRSAGSRPAGFGHVYWSSFGCRIGSRRVPRRGIEVGPRIGRRARSSGARPAGWDRRRRRRLHHDSTCAGHRRADGDREVLRPSGSSEVPQRHLAVVAPGTVEGVGDAPRCRMSTCSVRPRMVHREGTASSSPAAAAGGTRGARPCRACRRTRRRAPASRRPATRCAGRRGRCAAGCAGR